MAEHIVHTGSVTADLAQLMQGRDTRFYRGFLAKLTAIIVSLLNLPNRHNADRLVVPRPHYVDDQRIRWQYDERSADPGPVASLLPRAQGIITWYLQRHSSEYPCLTARRWR
jgi:hypothetical protein